MLYTVKVVQHGMGLAYGYATYQVNAASDQEARDKARAKARRDGLAAGPAVVVKHEHEEE